MVDGFATEILKFAQQNHRNEMAGPADNLYDNTEAETNFATHQRRKEMFTDIISTLLTGGGDVAGTLYTLFRSVLGL